MAALQPAGIRAADGQDRQDKLHRKAFPVQWLSRASPRLARWCPNGTTQRQWCQVRQGSGRARGSSVVDSSLVLPYTYTQEHKVREAELHKPIGFALE